MFKIKTTLNQPNLLAQRMSVLGEGNPIVRPGVFSFGRKHQAASSAKRSVILVHWDARIGSKLAKDLQNMGFAVQLESRNPSEAYRAIRTSNPDMVVIDMTVNPSQGLAVYQALRYISTTKNIPVIFVGDEEVNMENANVHFIDSSNVTGCFPTVAESVFSTQVEH